jgi:drug/metabolite transporter (DMT)-like permease
MGSGARHRQGERGREAVALVTLYLVWGSTYLAIRLGLDGFPPFVLGALRFFIGGGAILLFLRWRGLPLGDRREWMSAAVVGTLLLLGGNGLVIWSEQWVPTGVAAVLVATVPLWTVLLEALLFRAPPSRWAAAAVLVGTVGVAVLAGPRDWGVGGVPWWGAAALLVASLSWAAGTVLARRLSRPTSALTATGQQMLFGGLGFAVVALALGEFARWDPTRTPPTAWAALAYLVVAGSWIGFTAYLWLLEHSTPARATSYAYVNPAVAVLLGWALRGEPLTGRVLLALLLVAGAVALVLRDAVRPVPAAPPARRRRPRSRCPAP